VVIVIDDGEVTREENIVLEEGLVGVTLLDLSESLGSLVGGPPWPAPDGRRRPARRAQRQRCRMVRAPDAMTAVEAEALARRLSPYGWARSRSPATRIR